MIVNRDKGYLSEIGWFESFMSKTPQRSSGEKIPWTTYSFIDFIEPRLRKGLSVFEYGSGASTEFYAKKVGNVTSVEHNGIWYNKVKKRNIHGSNLILNEDNNLYSETIVKLDSKFDIVIIDGIDRVNCCIHSPVALTKRGIIILDDSERNDYKEGIDFIKEQGFKKLDFLGNISRVIL